GDGVARLSSRGCFALGLVRGGVGRLGVVLGLERAELDTAGDDEREVAVREAELLGLRGREGGADLDAGADEAREIIEDVLGVDARAVRSERVVADGSKGGRVEVGVGWTRELGKGVEIVAGRGDLGAGLAAAVRGALRLLLGCLGCAHACTLSPA